MTAAKNKKSNGSKPENVVDLTTALGMLRESYGKNQRKFVEAVDMVFNLNIDAKQSNQNIRGSVALPAGLGKQVRIIVFTDSDLQQREVLEAGATRAGFGELIDEIDAGFMGFDYCIATPGVMKSLSKIAKKLGPRGLMPNPKNGNVTDDVVEAVKVALKGKLIFKNDRYGIVHANIGKINFSDGDLIANIKAIVATLKELKPDAIKNKYIKSVYLTTTMGPSVAVDVDKIGGGR
ncbi:MAG: 50S ribosomal protein L1 [Rickettsiales bacterium]|jgi:large subunit ribosomal protein L1|nr:50S ribosomal protein L1 [Rickettsiales bacterium]